MTDVNALQELFARFARAMDNQEFHRLHDVFADDAIFSGRFPGGEFDVKGKKAVIDFITTTTRAQTDRRRHVITNTMLDGHTQGRALLLLVVVDAGRVTVKTSGEYVVELVREAGELRFGRMDLELDAQF